MQPHPGCLPLSISRCSRLRAWINYFNLKGRADAGVLIKRYVSISGGLSARREKRHEWAAQVAFFPKAVRKYFRRPTMLLFFKCFDGQLHFCLTLASNRFLANGKIQKSRQRHLFRAFRNKFSSKHFGYKEVREVRIIASCSMKVSSQSIKKNIRGGFS